MPPNLVVYRWRSWLTSVGPFMSPGSKYFTPKGLSSISSVDVSDASSGGQTVISATESKHTKISFGFSITEPKYAAVPPAHGDGCFTSLALSSMFFDGCIRRTEFLQLELGQLSFKSCNVSFPLVGHEVTFSQRSCRLRWEPGCLLCLEFLTFGSPMALEPAMLEFHRLVRRGQHRCSFGLRFLACDVPTILFLVA